MTRIHVYPGQGSQAVGMGAGLFERYETLCDQADDILGYSLRELCLEGPAERLNDTAFTQPALFAVCAMMHLERVEAAGKPDFCAGHSLGEYAALFAAGAFDFATGLRLVHKRGEIMSRADGGAMAAIIGPEAGEIAAIIAANGLDSIDIANYNAPTQTVVSGPRADLEAAAAVFQNHGVKIYKVLPVSGAFHSRYMRAAAAEFESFLAGINFHALQVPVIANASAEPYTDDNVKENLVRQIDHGVRWVETVRLLKQQPEPEFIEVGPGKVLAGLIRRIS